MTRGLPDHLHRILDLARWAPSGDNTQPWRFEVLGDEHLLVHGFDTRDHVVYDLDGHASQLAVGALLETLVIAATTQGRRCEILRREDTPETHTLFDVLFIQDASVPVDPLAGCIQTRVVQRRPMSTRPLSDEQKAQLSAVLAEGHQVVWLERLARRWQMARFLFANAKVRLTIPEAYEVHKAVIEWGARFSEDKIPEQAVGVDAMTARFMRWAMSSWRRVHFFNTYLLGHLLPRIQLDLLPGVFCAGHFALQASGKLESVDDFVAAGRVMQRFWLKAAQLGLLIQPEMTPVIFTRYWRSKRVFTSTPRAYGQIDQLNRQFAGVLRQASVDGVFFLGRVGTGPIPRARSTRRSVAALLYRGA